MTRICRRNPAILVLPLAVLPSAVLAQAFTTGSGPYTSPYLQGPTRPLDGTPRSGVYAAEPAPKFYTPPRHFPARRDQAGADEAGSPDLPPIWGGLYVGAHAGRGWSSTAVNGWSVPALQPAGFVGGVHAGYDKAIGNAVVGLEGDVTMATASATSVNATTSASATLHERWSSTLRARAGYAFGPALLYATGGVAVANQSATFNAPSVSATANDVRVGAVFGGGVEYKFTQKFSTRVEALHYSFSGSGLNWNAAAPSLKQDSNVLRAGVSFHFN